MTKQNDNSRQLQKRVEVQDYIVGGHRIEVEKKAVQEKEDGKDGE